MSLAPFEHDLQQQAGVAVRKQSDDRNKPTLMFGALMRAQVEMLANRRNTVSGTVYREDSAILAWELCNECQTSSSYEQRRGLPPGQLLYNYSVRQIFRCSPTIHSPVGHLPLRQSTVSTAMRARKATFKRMPGKSEQRAQGAASWQRVHMSCNAGMD